MQRKPSSRVAVACIALHLLAAGALLCVTPARAESRAEPTLADLQAHFRRPPDPPARSAADLAAIAVGRTLFFTTTLSATGAMSCATCHEPAGAWKDGRARALDNAGVLMARHAPTLLNLAWASALTWDGRMETLEQQAIDPIVSPRMGALTPETILARVQTLLAADPALEIDYVTAFSARDVTLPRIAKAIAAFEASLVSPPAPFDRWIQGDPTAISPAARRGFAVFTGRGNCIACHDGWRLTDDGFHDIGMPDADLGRGAKLPREPTLQHAFKTPTLRDVGIRGPYMHDGSISTLDAVIDHYDGHHTRRDSLDPEMRTPDFTSAERADLRAFLDTLSSPASDAVSRAIETGLE